MTTIRIVLLTSMAVCSLASAEVSVACRDEFHLIPSNAVVLRGPLGQRVDANRTGILLHKDEEALLQPFRERGLTEQVWIGEHVGKWLSAASIACAQAPDDRLAAKLNRIARALIDAQKRDGYLGTYLPANRWVEWDVWVHKYNLLGLLDYHDFTGEQSALDACRKIGDLMINTFGPGKRDIVDSGVHMGMAATSILEPMVRLYHRTGDDRYLRFTVYIVDTLEHPRGPQIVDTLLEQRSVLKTANAKAYEMISNLLGLVDYYRLAGGESIRKAAEFAFDDIVNHRLYITGGCTFGEFFRETGYLPNVGSVAETCVSMSLVQFYRTMLLLTGQPCYGEAAEHLIFNHLLACQRPDGESVCYYTPLWGHKLYMDFLGCCISSGPRAIALIPSLCYLQTGNDVVINLPAESELNASLAGGSQITVVQHTDYPFSDKVFIETSSARPGHRLIIRIPSTAAAPAVTVNGEPYINTIVSGRFLPLDIAGQRGRIDLDLGFRWQIIRGVAANEGLFALQFGPVIYAYDYAANRDKPNAIEPLFDADLEALKPRLIREEGCWKVKVAGYLRDPSGDWKRTHLTLLPFMSAGEKEYFSVWLRDRAAYNGRPLSIYTDVRQAASRAGSNNGSITDNASRTFSGTDNGERRDEDWFEVNSGWHTKYNVIVFRHGRTFPNGGWFDTSRGKPKVYLKSWKEHRLIGELEDYPETTATNAGCLTDGQAFRFVIPFDQRKSDHSVRIAGAPAHGDDPSQNFTTCSEIQVFYDPDL